MASRKATSIFLAAVDNDGMLEKLSEIAVDDRWQRGQERFNNEIAEWAFHWARKAFEHFNRMSPSKQDAKTVLQIAILALEWRTK